MIKYKYLPIMTMCFNYCIFKIIIAMCISQTWSEINTSVSLTSLPALGKWAMNKFQKVWRSIWLSSQSVGVCLIYLLSPNQKPRKPETLLNLARVSWLLSSHRHESSWHPCAPGRGCTGLARLDFSSKMFLLAAEVTFLPCQCSGQKIWAFF